ncbi:MAG: hypothetical protein WBE72_01700 [Terracidiphilus sp.]
MGSRLPGASGRTNEELCIHALSESAHGNQIALQLENKGGLSASNYSTMTDASPATTTRGLADLVEKGALIPTGKRRNARYTMNLT